MVMYDNEFETKENKIWTKDKIEPQHRHYFKLTSMTCKIWRETKESENRLLG